MKLDRSFRHKLGMSAGGFNRESGEMLKQSQSEYTKSKSIMTNQTPINRNLAPVVEQFMKKVQSGEMTMAEAANLINQLPGEKVEKKQAPVKPKPKKQKPKRERKKFNESFQEQLKRIKLND